MDENILTNLVGSYCLATGTSQYILKFTGLKKVNLNFHPVAGVSISIECPSSAVVNGLRVTII